MRLRFKSLLYLEGCKKLSEHWPFDDILPWVGFSSNSRAVENRGCFLDNGMFLQKVFHLMNQSVASNNNKAGFPALDILSSLREISVPHSFRSFSQARDLFPPWFGFVRGNEGEFSLSSITQFGHQAVSVL